MSSPILDEFLDHKIRQLGAPRLADEIGEAIARWFDGRTNSAQNQGRILGALSAVLVDQILQHPDPKVQNEIADRVLAVILRAVKRHSVHRRMGGVQVTLIKQ